MSIATVYTIKLNQCVADYHVYGIYTIHVIHVDDRIFCEWASLLTIGLGHKLSHPVSSLQYSSLCAIKVAKNGKSD